MALGQICCTTGISKTRRSSAAGFLFVLLLQMSLQIFSSVEATTAEPTSLSSSTSAESETTSLSSSISAVTDSGTTASQTPGLSSSISAVTESGITASVNISPSATAISSTSQSVALTTANSSPSVSSTASSTTNAHLHSSSSSSSVSSVYDTFMTSASAGNRSSSAGNDSMVGSCPVVACTSDCYSQYMNATARPCPSNASFCEVTKQDTSYSVSCSSACVPSCGNATLSNCTINCCNTSSCLNNTLFSLTSSFTTTATTTSTTTITTLRATATTTQANNGKMCQNIKCDGATCYKTSGSPMLCPIGQEYCMLKKTTSGSVESWQGGCSTDCRTMAPCSGTVTTCHLECCNATTTKICLKLTGELNMPNSASRGPHSPALVLASALLLWILRVFN